MSVRYKSELISYLSTMHRFSIIIWFHVPPIHGDSAFIIPCRVHRSFFVINVMGIQRKKVLIYFWICFLKMVLILIFLIWWYILIAKLLTFLLQWRFSEKNKNKNCPKYISNIRNIYRCGSSSPSCWSYWETMDSIMSYTMAIWLVYRFV